MRVLLDDQVHQFSSESIGEALAHAAGLAESNRRVIVDVIVDGTRWDEAKLESEAMCAGFADEIQLESADLFELVGETLDGAFEALAEADEFQRTAAAELDAGRLVDAMNVLKQAIEIWVHVQEAVVKSALAMQIDLENLTFESGSLQDAVGRLANHLQQLRDALAASDDARMSDILAYELPETVVEWRSVLESLRDRARRERN